MNQERLRADIHAIVADRAVLQKTIYYGELVDTLKRMDPESYDWNLMPHYRFFHELLGDISGRTLEKQGFALTALVIGKGSGLPGESFLEWGMNEQWPHYEEGAKAMIAEQQRLAFKHYRIDR